jgi:glucan phosphoethanolaminetransferase (alkaline phosphatase superfamily)
VEIFVVLAGVFISQASMPNENWSRAVQIILQAIALVLTLRLGTLPRPVIAVGRIVVVVAIVTAVIAAFSDNGHRIMLFVNLVLVALAPIAIFRSIVKHRQISWATVVASLAIYLCIGLFFACFHQIIYEFDTEAFAVGNGVLRPATFQYFSFITLTTVGFGDVVAVSDLARTMTALEAIIGQIFLVTVVALVVGNIGRTRN